MVLEAAFGGEDAEEAKEVGEGDEEGVVDARKRAQGASCDARLSTSKRSLRKAGRTRQDFPAMCVLYSRMRALWSTRGTAVSAVAVLRG